MPLITEAEPGVTPMELTLTRIIKAPRALVWEAWTDPRHNGRWGPSGFTMEHVKGEPWVGGEWRIRLRSTTGGSDLWQGGRFLEIVEQERLVYTFAWDDDDGRPGHEMLITLTFEDYALDPETAPKDRTRLTLHQTGFRSVESRDGHASGWGQALDSLAVHLTALDGASAQGAASP
jgi:uncharacterized protein YndB with AHSA1/START domain